MASADVQHARSLSGTGWEASIELCFSRRNERTVLAEKRQYGPLTVQRSFYPEGDVCHLYLLHPPGGIAGGDRLRDEAFIKIPISLAFLSVLFAATLVT